MGLLRRATTALGAAPGARPCALVGLMVVIWLALTPQPVPIQPVLPLPPPPGTGAAGGAPAAWDGRLAIASYNVQLTTPDIPLLSLLLREFPGHKPNVKARARAIGERLACLDIVALQETIHDRRRAELLDQLERSGSACDKPSRLASGRMFEVVSGPDRPRSAIPGLWRHEQGWRLGPLVDQELAIASRFPILTADQHVFRAAASEDVLAAKGVLHARIDLAGRPLEVYVTHFQAGDAQLEVRRAQLDELAEFVRATADPSAPILVMGDFNVQSNAAERRDDASEYRALLRALDRAIAPRRFADLWLETHPERPDIWSWTKPKRPWKPQPQRIDLMLLAGADGMAPLAMGRDFLAHGMVADGRPVGHLSNHAALIAELAWSLAPPSQQPIASVRP